MKDDVLIHDDLCEIFADLFELETGQVTAGLQREAVRLWDSLNHLRLISAIEERYGVKFSMAEIESIDGVPRLLALLEQRTA
jgi:acyl carrier protein